MDRQIDTDFKQDTCLSLLIHTDMLMKILGLVKKHRDTVEETEDESESDGK